MARPDPDSQIAMRVAVPWPRTRARRSMVMTARLRRTDYHPLNAADHPPASAARADARAAPVAPRGSRGTSRPAPSCGSSLICSITLERGERRPFRHCGIGHVPLSCLAYAARRNPRPKPNRRPKTAKESGSVAGSGTGVTTSVQEPTASSRSGGRAPNNFQPPIPDSAL